MRPDLQQILDDLDTADRTADALVQPLTDAQFHFAPPAGSARTAAGRNADGPRGWSIAQCLDHLATINALYSRPLGQAVEDARGKGLTGGAAIASSYFGRRFIASQEPPVVRRLKAPAKSRPRPAGTRDEIMTAFHAAHATIREIVRRAAEIDVNRATFPNPFLPLVRVRVGTGLRILTAHDRRHLWQAEQVTRAAGFPRESRAI